MIKKTCDDAIILSSTYKERTKYLVGFLKHLCISCAKIRNKYRVLPVIVFEEIEKIKAQKIKKIFDKSNYKVKPLVLINKESSGFSGCLNFGIKNTISDYIIRIDTDDLLISNRITKQIDMMRQKNIDICTGYMKNQDDIILKYPSKLYSLLFKLALGNNPISHPTVCIKRELLQFRYDENLKRCEDFALWINLFLVKDLKYHCLKEPLTFYNDLNAYKKDRENAFKQIKIRFKFIIKLSLVLIVLLLGIFPNIIRLVSGHNLLLKIRRRI